MDCCQLFVPPRPALAASLDDVRAAEERLDLPGLIQTALNAAEEERLTFPEPATDPSC